MDPLKNQTALITGSSTGIGKAIVQELAGSGANIIINYNTHKSEALNLQAQLRDLGHAVETIQADITHRSDVKEMVQSVIHTFGGIDILINNAGITKDRTLQKMAFEDWDDVLNVNLTGAFNVTKEVIPYMVEKKSGNIINIASVIASTGAFGQVNYAASKAGLIGFTRSCALELARSGICVNAICPGFIDTEMLASIPEEIRQNIIKKIPLGRIGSPNEIAKVVKFIVSESTYITGQCLHVNGGIFLG